MKQRGIRGAVTAENNVESVKSAVEELLSELINANNINPDNISHVIFTMTKDIDCIYPAKVARELFEDWKYVPFMCIGEQGIKNSLEKCIRVLIVINTDAEQKDIKHIYLRDAKKLRPDLNNV